MMQIRNELFPLVQPFISSEEPPGLIQTGRNGQSGRLRRQMGDYCGYPRPLSGTAMTGEFFNVAGWMTSGLGSSTGIRLERTRMEQ